METSKDYFEDILRRFDAERRGRSLFQFCKDEAVNYKDLMAYKPLVIDQPEENLDNESVFKYLVNFIKKAKERRQIIMVTHNPNLAVVCDADQIIQMKIDKQHGNKVSYVAGAIENPVVNKIIVDILEGTYPAFHNRDCKYFDKTL